jgi:hypothetical protein
MVKKTNSKKIGKAKKVSKQKLLEKAMGEELKTKGKCDNLLCTKWSETTVLRKSPKKKSPKKKSPKKKSPVKKSKGAKKGMESKTARRAYMKKSDKKSKRKSPKKSKYKKKQTT